MFKNIIILYIMLCIHTHFYIYIVFTFRCQLSNKLNYVLLKFIEVKVHS